MPYALLQKSLEQSIDRETLEGGLLLVLLLFLLLSNNQSTVRRWREGSGRCIS